MSEQFDGRNRRDEARDRVVDEKLDRLDQRAGRIEAMLTELLRRSGIEPPPAEPAPDAADTQPVEPLTPPEPPASDGGT